MTVENGPRKNSSTRSLLWSIVGLTGLGLSAAAIVSALNATSLLSGRLDDQPAASDQQEEFGTLRAFANGAAEGKPGKLVSQLSGEVGTDSDVAAGRAPTDQESGVPVSEPAAMTTQQIAETNRRKIEALEEAVRLHDRRLLSLMDKLDSVSQELTGVQDELETVQENSSQLTEQHLELERAQGRLLEVTAGFEKFIADELPQIRRALGTRSETKASTGQESAPESESAQQASIAEKTAERGMGTLVIDNQTERTISILVNGQQKTLQPGRNSFAVPIGDVRVEGENRSWLLDSGLWQDYRGQQVLYRDKWPL